MSIISACPLQLRARKRLKCGAFTKRIMSHNPPVTDLSTAPLAIRTPFIQPSDCKTQWMTTTGIVSVTYGDAVTMPIMISDPAATCYPSGWDEFPSESRLNFKPGVCPEGWVYLDMAEDGSPRASTAFCCNRCAPEFFSPGGPARILRPICLPTPASLMIAALTAAFMLQRLHILRGLHFVLPHVASQQSMWEVCPEYRRRRG